MRGVQGEIFPFFLHIFTEFQLEKNCRDPHGDMSRRARWMSCVVFVCATCWSFEAGTETGSGSLALPSNSTMSLLRSAASNFLMSHSTTHITAANFTNQETPARIIYQETECQKQAKKTLVVLTFHSSETTDRSEIQAWNKVKYSYLYNRRSCKWSKA